MRVHTRAISWLRVAKVITRRENSWIAVHVQVEAYEEKYSNRRVNSLRLVRLRGVLSLLFASRARENAL